MKKPKIHYTASYLISPTNPITVNVLGAGGTGSKVCELLAGMHTALRAFNHPGLQVRLFDRKDVREANLGRQLYFRAEIGRPKAHVLIDRLNRQHGTRWQGFNINYCRDTIYQHSARSANIFISCVDTVAARFELAAILSELVKENRHSGAYPYYWLDFGNQTHTGQAILATPAPHKQARSKACQPVAYLPPVTEQYAQLLQEAATTETDTPSCSAAQALNSQDLFINGTLAVAGMRLLYDMLRQARTSYRGVFVNLHNLTTVGIPL